MPDSRLRIVIDALNLARGQASEIEKELAGVEGQAKKTGGALETLKKGKAIFTDLTGAVAGFGATFKGALELGKAGAQLEMMDSKFDKLAVSIGTTGDLLEARLNATMGGTVSKANQVESAVTLMNLGLAKTEGEVVRMSSVSQKLNWDMQILGLTIANESTMRLDALGLSIEDVTDRQKKLTAQGLSTSAAFREAILQAGEAKAALLGLDGQTQNSTRSFAKFEAATTDIADALKRKLTPELAKAFEAGALLLTWNEKIEAAQREHAKQVVLISDSYEEYTAEIARARGVQDGYIDSMGNLVKTSGLGYGITEQLVVAHAALTRAQYDQARAVEQAILKWKDYKSIGDEIGYVEQTKAVEIVKDTAAIKAQEAALNDLKATIQGAVSNEYNQFIERQADLRTSLDEVKTQYGVWSQQYKDRAAEVNKALDENTRKHEDATKRIILGFLEQRLAVDGWSEKEIAAFQSVARQMGLIDDSTWSMIGGVNDALKSLETGSMEEFLAKIEALKNQSLGLASSSPLGPPTGGGGGKVESYQSGGVVPGPMGMPRLAIVHGGEEITPASHTVNNYYQNERGGDTYIVNDARAWAMIQAQRRLAAVEARYG